MMTGMSRSHQHRAGQPPARAAMLFAALVAVFLQAFVVQTHVHAFAPMGAGYEQSATHAVGDDAHVTSAGHAFSCAICDVLATAGHTTLPEATTVAVKIGHTNESAALAIRRAPRALTHSWQSRAPPIAL